MNKGNYLGQDSVIKISLANDIIRSVEMTVEHALKVVPSCHYSL